MDQRNLLTQALGFIQEQRRRRWWLRVVAGMASVVVFVTVYLLILPAITMENAPLQVTADPRTAVFGEALQAEIFARAEDGRDETVFVLKAAGSNAGLEESGIAFNKEGTAVIAAQEGRNVELHREYGKDGTVSYWFCLAKGQSARFSLPWINGANRYRAEVTEEQVPVVKEIQPEEAAQEPVQTTEGENPQKPAASAEGGDSQQPAGGSEGGDSQGTEGIEGENLQEPAEGMEGGNSQESSEGTKEGEPQKTSEGAEGDNSQKASAGSAEGTSQKPQQIVEYETVYHTEIVLEQAGDASKKGTLKLSFGSGASLEDAQSRAEETLELSWVEKTEEVSPTPTQEPENGASGEDGDNSSNLSGDDSGNAGSDETKKNGTDSSETNSNETDSNEMNLDGSNSTENGSADSNSGEEDSERIRFTVSPIDSTKIRMFSAGMEAAGLADNGAVSTAENGDGHNFAENITSVTVSRLVNGTWVPGTEFTDGDSVRVEINYTIPANTVGESNKTIYYQLPEGIRLSKEESGTVYDGQTPVGKYEIGTDGKIIITFEENFADNNAFTGMIRFEGTLSKDESENEEQIEFGGDGGIITIKPNTSPTDIHIEKEGSYNKDEGMLHYTVTVSTEKGTGDTVTISDAFAGGNTLAAYDKDSFTLVKIDKNNGRVEIPKTDYTIDFGTVDWNNNWEKFSISGLPKLEAGEKYIVTYTATPKKSSQDNGASNVSNSATGTSGGDSSSGWCDVTISKEMIKKWGYHDSGTGKIKWTITLNPDKKDIGGYILNDTMMINGQEHTIPVDTVITMTGSGETSQTITLPYTFPPGSSDTYTITYETDAPSEGEPGELWSVSNKVELDGDGEHYEGSSGDITGQIQDYDLAKASEGLEQNSSTDTEGTYKWVSRITVPKKDVDLEKITYTDTLIGASLDGGSPVEGSHYITPKLLGQLTITVGGTTLVRGTDYQICDTEGKMIEDFTGENHLNGFQVSFLDTAKSKIIGKTIELRYQTKVDYTKLTGDGTYKIVNKGNIPEHESAASVTWEKPKKLEKQASITGVHTDNSFTGNPISIDYTSSGGTIHYRVLIRTDKDTGGDITLTDLLPAGAALVKDSVTMSFYGNEWWEFSYIEWQSDNEQKKYIAADNISYKIDNPNEDGTTQVIFTIQDGYNGDGNQHTLAVYYDVTIKDDPAWEEDPSLEEQLYRNKVTWGTENSEMEVTVEREVPEIEKVGEQLPQYNADGEPITDDSGKPVLSDIIRYCIVINAGGKDLVPGMDFIELRDQLNIGKAAGAEFRPGSVKLYQYDPDKENSCGAEMDSSLYTYIYDEKEYKLTFTLPDETACVLVYEYAIDRGNAAGDLTIYNEANLTGGASSGGKDETTLVDTSSSATATKKVLTIYKVDATNYGKLLPGAVFELAVYQKNDENVWKWKKLADFTTNDNGLFTLSRADDETFPDFTFQDNVLYRLTEKTAPSGYDKDFEPYYFVWVENGKTADVVKQAMSDNGALGKVESEEVRFLTTSGAIYVPNEPMELSVRKSWQNENGTATSPGANSVEVALYQQAVKSNAVTVKVKWQTAYNQGEFQSIDIAKGSDLSLGVNIWSDISYIVGSGERQKVAHEQGVCMIKLEQIDTDIEITLCLPYDITNTDVTFSNYTTPYNVPVGDATQYQRVDLNADNNWSYTWFDLPKQNENGQTLYYYVKELTSLPGFETIYSSNNNSGIQSGELVIINRSSGYVLPETGGGGISLFTAGGLALIVLASLMYIIMRRKEHGAP